MNQFILLMLPRRIMVMCAAVITANQNEPERDFVLLNKNNTLQIHSQDAGQGSQTEMDQLLSLFNI